MKESMWGYYLVLLGVIIIIVMMLLQNYTTTNQQDYYLIKEITYASMYDSIDFGEYKSNVEDGNNHEYDLKIVKEKFVENFIRRFAENATLNKSYTINFYSISEQPPMVSVEVKAKTGEYHIGEEAINADVTTRLTAILEMKD